MGRLLLCTCHSLCAAVGFSLVLQHSEPGFLYVSLIRRMSLTYCQRFLFGIIAFCARFSSCICDMYSVTPYLLAKDSLWYSSILYQVFLLYLWYVQYHSILAVKGFSLLLQHSVPGFPCVSLIRRVLLHTCWQRFLFGTLAFSTRFSSCTSDMYSVTPYLLSKVSLWYSSIQC